LLAGLLAGCRESCDTTDRSLESLQPSRPYQFPAPERIVAIGDLHGDLGATRRALRLAGAIDENDSWIGGGLVVVQTGDQIDRGDDDREVLDLLDRLSSQAKVAGGALHALNGNHEQMNVAGDFRYVAPGSLAAFGKDGVVARRRAFAPGGSYARLMAERNTVLVVGRTAFAHGGLLPEHARVGIGKLNEAVRRWMSGELAALPAVAGGERSPVWLRDLSDGAPDPSSCASLAETLSVLGVDRLVVGHTIQENGINSACGGRVWRIDVGLARHYGRRPVEVLEIVGDRASPLRAPGADAAPKAERAAD
jgi:hypothetical protein